MADPKPTRGAIKTDNPSQPTNQTQPPPPSTSPTSNKEQKLINLLRGWPSPHLLPTTLLRTASHTVLSTPSIAVPALQYAPDPGYQPLRETIATWTSQSYQPYGSSRPVVRADEIAITGGASQGLACVLQSFTDPGYTRVVWMAAPGYFLAGPVFEDAGFAGRMRAVGEDEGGVELGGLEEGLRGVDERYKGGEEGGGVYKEVGPHRKWYRHVVYLVATSGNPSGKTLSMERREGLVRLARRYDALVISDDVYDLLQWPTSPLSSSTPKPLPTLSQIDATLPYDGPENPGGKRFGNAISNASFSKLVGPGIRTGWIHGTPDFVHGFSQTGSNRSGGAASQFSAAVVHQVLASGELDRWLEVVVRPGLRKRWQLIVEAIETELAGLGVKLDDARGVFGGYFVWLTLPGGVDAEVLAGRANEEENLIIAPGRLFEIKGDEETARFPGNVRLCFSWEDEEDVVDGVRRLGRVLRRVLDGAAGVGQGLDEAETFEKELRTAC